MKSFRSLTLAFALAAALAHVGPAQAQIWIGVDGGIADVHDFDGAKGAFGAQALFGLGEHWSLLASYTQWAGEDTTKVDSVAGDYYGNFGANVGIQFHLFSNGSASWSIGGGFGEYETIRVDDGGAEKTVYTGAFTGTTAMHLRFGERSALFVRVDLSTPTDEFRGRWGAAVAGIEVGIP